MDHTSWNFHDGLTSTGNKKKTGDKNHWAMTEHDTSYMTILYINIYYFVGIDVVLLFKDKADKPHTIFVPFSPNKE